jgi:hypothetical protein
MTDLNLPVPGTDLGRCVDMKDVILRAIALQCDEFLRQIEAQALAHHTNAEEIRARRGNPYASMARIADYAGDHCDAIAAAVKADDTEQLNNSLMTLGGCIQGFTAACKTLGVSYDDRRRIADRKP